MSDSEEGEVEAEDFELLLEHIKAGEEESVKDLIDSKNFSKESWITSTTLGREHSPLQAAVLKGRLGIVRCLLERGMDYFNDNRASPLVTAVRCGHLDIVRAFVEEFGHDINVNDGNVTAVITNHGSLRLDSGDNLVLQAIRKENNELVKYLVNAGAEINWIGSGGSVLHELAKSDNLEICEFILSRGFRKLNARDSCGRTAFFAAFVSCSWSICDILVEHGADVNIGTNSCSNLFMLATRIYDLDAIKRLYGYGANPHADTPTEEGPIEWAVRKNNYILVHYLAVVLNVPLNGPLMQEWLSKCPTLVPQNIRLDHLSTKILLLKAGIHVGSGLRDSLSSYVTKVPYGEASTYINEVLSHPRSLADMCCFQIRHVLGKSLPERVDRLPLPQKLIDFVKLTHVEPIEYTDAVSDTDEDDEHPMCDHDYQISISSAEIII